MSLTYLYVRNKFGWTEIEYGTYIGVKSIIHTIGSLHIINKSNYLYFYILITYLFLIIGTFIIVSIFKKRFKMPEKYIGIIGGISQIMGPIAFMFSFNTYAIFGSKSINTVF